MDFTIACYAKGSWACVMLAVSSKPRGGRGHPMFVTFPAVYRGVLWYASRRFAQEHRFLSPSRKF